MQNGRLLMHIIYKVSCGISVSYFSVVLFNCWLKDISRQNMLYNIFSKMTCHTVWKWKNFLSCVGQLLMYLLYSTKRGKNYTHQ